MTRLTTSEFRTLALQGKAAPRHALITRTETASVEVAGDRVRRFTISTPVIDRAADIVRQDGWDLDAFRRNPVVLWQHDQDGLPVGKVTTIGLVGGNLSADVEFVPADVPVIGEKAEAILRLIDAGFLSATSVGFGVVDYEVVDRADGRRGVDFVRQELRELSIVTVPCNPEALISDAPKAADVDVAKASSDAARARRMRIAAAS